MFTLLKNADVYQPQRLGRKDVLLCGGKVVAIEESIAGGGLPGAVETVDCQGKVLSPGLIDQHVHLIGGGGEGGFATRTPAVLLSKLIRAGTTTVVGVLGTDGISRSPKDLYAKAKGINQEGLSAFIHTGSYELPTRTITGNVRDDVAFIDLVLGVKIAMADHRGSFPTTEELMRVVSDLRVASLLAGKKGVLHIHMGALPGAFDQINTLLGRGLPIRHISPTHCGRTEALFKDAVTFAKAGGHIDITSGGTLFKPAAEVVRMALEAGVKPELVTISSDGNGSQPRFDANGKTTGVGAADVDSNLVLLPRLLDEKIALEQALAMLTANVADSLGIAKGRLEVGADADLCLFDSAMQIDRVYARGRLMMSGKDYIALGNFE